MDRLNYALANLPRDLKARRRRILAAIAAVDGVPTEALESGALRQLIEGCLRIRPCLDRHYDLGTASLLRRAVDDVTGRYEGGGHARA